ncbi:uncharacterized protein LOC131957927 [Physella acuta]|uniref:uncharacterized protein LOC131957927 n=1 Tax=Physella acuta TaxID=109671 RepID=UPI0027DB774B|nr:uncharacterized protein LOC131957927 [Physella acuta]
MGYGVFMFGFDSMSRMAWLRNLPKSREFYTRDLKGMELTGYNIVGDATVNNLLPLLTGQSLKDLYSARWDDPYASHVDDFPFIWKSFKSAGYVTAWGEDKAYGGTFQMRLVGFNSTPTDHSMRPYYVAAESMYANFLPYCVGSEPRHIRFLNWFKDVFKMYGRKPKFVFGFHAEFSHDNNNQMKKMDDDLLTYLKYLNTSGYLDHTILILMSDHGARIDQIRGTPQGKLEERLPYFSFRFPPSFKKSFPEEFLNFKNNRPRLVTPFDVYETFHHMLNVRGPPVDHSKNRGTSLFRVIPKTRTCADVEVKPHFCSCANLKEVKNESMLNRLSNEVVAYINNQTNKVRNLCSILSLAEVINIFKYTTHGGTSNQHEPDPASLFQFYQVTFRTSPNDGVYEATVKHLVPSDTLVVSDWQISRINRYGDAAACIEQTFPFLRQFCFCKNNGNT